MAQNIRPMTKDELIAQSDEYRELIKEALGLFDRLAAIPPKWLHENEPLAHDLRARMRKIVRSETQNQTK